jgi:hypothetical protein
MNVRKKLMPNHRVFTLEDGRKFGAHKNSCLFCKHNTDIFYDYTNGIYMIICGLGLDDDCIVKAFDGKCNKWESDGTEDEERIH